MTERIRGKRAEEIICDDFSTFEKDTIFEHLNSNTSSPTSDEIISEIRKWADCIPEFLGAPAPEMSQEQIFAGLGIDKDFDCDRISMRIISDFCPITRNQSFLTTSIYA